MYIARYLKPEYVKLGLINGHLDEIDEEKDLEKEQARLKESVIEELTDLFMLTGQIRNRHKFLLDLVNREKQCSTAVGNGIAVPHVRSMQPRKMAVVFARSHDGVWYDAPDGKPVHIFFGITAPSYDDKAFLQFYKWVAQSFLQEDWLLDALLAAEDEHEIIAILSGLQ
ncbi:MAG: PTS sugar transporter subunit IIA [Planctomycetes bacterium]|nr:PTS sugar transporter subunit IIA [Planctomycetota bacterium]